MIYHILNGDALIPRFTDTDLDGQVIVARECLIEGDLQGETLYEFFSNRSRYIADTYHDKEGSYFMEVANEFLRLLSAPDSSEFNLWFGYDLFCRTNMWFILSILWDLEIEKKVFVVHPSYLAKEDRWKDFGQATRDDLLYCYQNRVAMTQQDLELGAELWLAYKNDDFQRLQQLSIVASPAFPFLAEVVQAHLDRRQERPEKLLRQIIDNGEKDFYSVYKEFFDREGVYGFGDDQVKRMYDKILNQ